MTDEEIDAIKARAERAPSGIAWMKDIEAHADRAALLAEVERLTADAAALREALAALNAALARAGGEA